LLSLIDKKDHARRDGGGWGWGLGADLHVNCSEMTINAVLLSEGQLQICAVLLFVTSTVQFHLFVVQYQTFTSIKVRYSCAHTIQKSMWGMEV